MTSHEMFDSPNASDGRLFRAHALSKGGSHGTQHTLSPWQHLKGPPSNRACEFSGSLQCRAPGKTKPPAYGINFKGRLTSEVRGACVKGFLVVMY